jgi:hypothetical protein
MIRVALILTAFLFFGKEASAQSRSMYSQIWGKNGEKWDKTRIPDFTESGYQNGTKPIPIYKTGVNIKDFGAVGDGITDDTKAFRNAIAKCGTNKAVYLPPGKYRITDTIQVKKSGVSIRGDKKKPSVLYFTKGIEELYPRYNLTIHQTPWSWSGGMLLFAGDISDSGVEDLTIQFPDSTWAGHNFHERGYNAVGFSQKAHNGWIKNVRLVGGDQGIWIERTAHHITADNITIDEGPIRGALIMNGHTAIDVYGGHCIFQNFVINAKYQHDLSVESIMSNHNIFRNGKGRDICIDHHEHAPANNLFTNIDAGAGTRLWASGGNATPRGISFNETYWNIAGAAPDLHYPSSKDDATKQSSNNVAVGVKNTVPSVFGDAHGNWYENIPPEKLYPADLYEAQLKYLKKKKK